MLRFSQCLLLLLLSTIVSSAQEVFVPMSLSYSPDGAYVVGVGREVVDGEFVAGTNGKVVVWDGVTGNLITTIEIPLAVDALLFDAAWSPNGDRLAVAAEDRKMWVLDFSDTAQPLGAVLAEVDTSTNFSVLSIAWSPDGSLIAIGGDDIAPRLEFRDGTTYEFIRASEYVVGAYRMAWNPDPQRKLIATTNLYLSGAQLADAATTVSTPPLWLCQECAPDAIAVPVAWNSDGTLLAIGHNNGSIFVVNAETDSVLFDLQTAQGVSVLAWTNDDQYLLSMSQAGLQVWNSVTGELEYTPSTVRTARFDINPLNDQLFFYDIESAPLGVIVDISTLLEPIPTVTPIPTPTPTPQPGAGWLLFVSNRPEPAANTNGAFNLYAADLSASSPFVQRLTNNADPNADDHRPVWSPDHTRVAFMRAIGADSDVCLLTLATETVSCTDTPDVREDYPAWSDSGLYLAYVSAADGELDIYKHTLNGDGFGAERVNLTHRVGTDGLDNYPDWHGDWIVYNSTRDGNTELYVMFADADAFNPADGQQRQQLTDSVDDKLHQQPAWSPLGDKIAYTRIGADGLEDTYIRPMTFSGGTWTVGPASAVTSNLPGRYQFMAWQTADPSQSTLAAVRHLNGNRDIVIITTGLGGGLSDLGAPVNTSADEDNPDW